MVHENFASVQIDGNFPRFLDILHRQRVRKCKGDCDKRWSGSVHVPRGDAEKPLTESKEGEDSDGKGEILHAKTVKIKPGKLKQWARGLWQMGEGRLVGGPILRSCRFIWVECRGRITSGTTNSIDESPHCREPCRTLVQNRRLKSVSAIGGERGV